VRQELALNVMPVAGAADDPPAITYLLVVLSSS
jgi:hypothetical protein